MKTLKELADIGTEAASKETDDMSISISPFSCHWQNEEPARQAFAAAVKEAVEKPLRDEIIVMGAKIEELEESVKLISHSWFPHPPPTPAIKTVPLDYTDIRATDEFRPCGEAHQLCTLRHANENGLSLFMLNGMYNLTYDTLATNYLRRQHGSNEWKPCTKEVTV